MIKVKFLGTPDFVSPVRNTIKDNFELVGKDPDLIVVASYGKILSKNELEAPKYGAINIHPSKLPQYRGPSPIQAQIIDDTRESAITFIKMDEEVDHGPILKSIPFEIEEFDTFESAVKRAFKEASLALPEVIKDYVGKKLKPIEQNHKEASFTQILKKEDGYFDADNPPLPDKLNRMIRAYYPWPGVWTKFNEKIIKLLPGGKIQVEGKKSMSYKDFINGYKEGKEFLRRLGL